MAALALLAAVFVIAAIAGEVLSRRIERKTPPVGEFVETGGVRLHLLDIPPREESAAAPVLLIHGASVNLRDMRIAFADKFPRRRLIMVDRPGRGYSARPKQGWRLAAQARLIRDAARERGVERPILVGQSFGGAVALAYALAFPDEISGLALLAPVSHPWPGGVAWHNRVSGWPVAGFLLRRLVIPLWGPVAARRGLEGAFGPGGAPDGYLRESGLPLLFRPKDFRANAEDLRRLKTEVAAMQSRYGSIRAPTVVLADEDDPTVSARRHAMALARDIPGAVYEALPGAGHALHHAETDRIVAAVERVAEMAVRAESGGAPAG